MAYLILIFFLEQLGDFALKCAIVVSIIVALLLSFLSQINSLGDSTGGLEMPQLFARRYLPKCL